VSAATSSQGSFDRRAFLSGLACAGASGAALTLTPKRGENRLLRTSLANLVPANIPPWHFGKSGDGVVVARPDETLPPEEYDQLVGRTYTTSRDDLPPVMLLVAYGSTQGSTLRLHRPETCYPAQGFRTSDVADTVLALGGRERIAARRLTETRDERVERILYWTRIGNEFPTSTLTEYSAILRSVLKGVVPDGVLVRISTILEDTSAADRAIDLFLNSLSAASRDEGQAVLFGHP
jgi:EpsI family protein